jgi:hypothetical protein
MVNIFFLYEDPKKSAQSYHDRQVNIMGTEVAQILYRIHNYLDSNIEYPFKNKKAINIGFGICEWIMESQENYKYVAKLGLELINENKFRYDKNYHHIEEKMKWLNKNIPKSIPNVKMTKFKLSKNVNSYHIAFPKILDACRYSYVDYKLLKKRTWKKRGKPDWIDEHVKKSNKIKDDELKLIEKMKQKYTSSEFEKKLDLALNTVFGKNWIKNKFMYGKMFTFNYDTILSELGSGHLRHLRLTLEELFK